MGMIHIICGDGKGKTSAAMGLAIRCAGRNKKVVIARFLKDNDSGEVAVLSQLANITLLPVTRCFGFTWNMTEQDKEEAYEYYTNYLKEAIRIAEEEQSELLILDEIISTYNNHLVDQALVMELLNSRPDHLEIVMTGRNPEPSLCELADYISEIKKIKHPYDKGVSARIGIEY